MNIFGGIDDVFLSVLYGLLILVALFIIFQLLYLKLPGHYVIRVLKGTAISLIGLVLFLQGVNIAFLPAGRAIGEALGTWDYKWILIPLGFFLGFLTTYSEPAVRILSNQVEERSSGSIRKNMVLYTISFGVAIAAMLGMIKLIYGVSLLYILIPGYLLALVIIWFSDKTFNSIAFDAGGVATGPMAVIFLAAITMGIASSMGSENTMVDGFGLIALIVLAPIISVLLLGLLYKRHFRRE
ncbi:MAG: DUF1538 domain-containing protein [Chloroflexi bacterium]|nr:DUF1538 domain-containing protein [Chloroflexota bacterium]